jgi:hypothetical protein
VTNVITPVWSGLDSALYYEERSGRPLDFDDREPSAHRFAAVVDYAEAKASLCILYIKSFLAVKRWSRTSCGSGIGTMSLWVASSSTCME